MEIGKTKQQASTMFMMWALVAGLLSQNLVVPVLASSSSSTFDDQKSYYPDPHPRSPPSSGSHGGGTPSHGSSGGSTPSHTPSHGGHTPTPSTPSGGNCGTPPSVPVPTTPTTPSTPYTPPTPSGTPPTPSGTPPTPIVETPPTAPGTPSVPPTPPFVPDPNSPFSCNYWRNHPALIWGILGWWGTTLGSAFGVTSLPGVGAGTSLQAALSNPRNDGYGTLYREGTASLLNSMVSNKFPYTTRQVRESFVAALSSNKAAAGQGRLFKQANEGKLKPRN